MVKTKLQMEQIVAAALLLNFESISSLDISLLAEDFLKKNTSYEINELNLLYLNKYIKIENEKISLKEGLTLESYIPENNSNLRKRLEQIAGARIRKHFQNFDLEEFILRKINHHIELSESDIDRLYCKIQQEEIKKLEEKRYLTTYWYDDCIYDDYKITKLSNYGKLKLFKIDYPKELERFIEELKSLRYDTSLLDDYLLKQDLELPVWSILNKERIDEFCRDYDRANLEPGALSIYYEKLESKKRTIFDENGKKLIQEMLSVWDDGHCIYICHPNHIFAGAKPITKDVREIKNINWNEIDVEKMYRINEYKTFVSSEYNEAFKYIHNHLGHQIMQEVKKGNKKTAISYLTVIEKYHFDYEDYYLVRGIIRGDYEGYSIAFNPEYQKVIPQSIWEKSLRFSGCEIPNAYCLKRKK